MSAVDTRARCQVCGGYRNPTLYNVLECCTCPDGPGLAQRHRAIILGVEQARQDRTRAETRQRRIREEFEV